jgi:hypothetical protein
MAIQSVRYVSANDGSSYFVEVKRGWIGKPALKMPVGFWHGTGYNPALAEEDKSLPNQAAEPTRTTVTPPAGAGDRASGALGVALTFLVARAAAPSEATTLESQFRADIEAFVRSKSPQPVQQDSLNQMVDQVVAEVKRSYPAVLKEDEKKEGPPTDDALTRAYNDLERVGGGAPRPVLVSFYTELWKSQRIQPQQRVILERLMLAVTEAVQKQKNSANHAADRMPGSNAPAESGRH